EVEMLLAAGERNPPVAYLTPGNPIVFDRVTQGVVEEAPRRGLSFEVFPGISSLDTMLVDLQRDIAPGLQIYDATSFVAARIEPRVDLDCLLFQIAVFGTPYIAVGHHPQSDAFVYLQEHLLRFYPAEHEIIQVTSASYPSADAQLNRFPLKNL